VAKQRTGARSTLNLIAKACKLSRTGGWRSAIITILGDESTEFLAVWDPFCAVVETLIGLDNWYNQIDYLPEVSNSEDLGVA